MNKLKLNPDDLTVETFESAAAFEQRGTVEAREFVPTQVITLCRTGCVSSPCICF
jgi:hypothetical protein